MFRLNKYNYMVVYSQTCVNVNIFIYQASLKVDKPI